MSEHVLSGALPTTIISTVDRLTEVDGFDGRASQLGNGVVRPSFQRRGAAVLSSALPRARVCGAGARLDVDASVHSAAIEW